MVLFTSLQTCIAAIVVFVRKYQLAAWVPASSNKIELNHNLLLHNTVSYCIVIMMTYIETLVLHMVSLHTSPVPCVAHFVHAVTDFVPSSPR